MIPRFRAWDVLAEKMIDEILMISFVRKEIIGKFSDGSTSVPLKFEDERNGEDVILMQSTGLRDELDEELFEGDVILWTYWDEFEDSGSAKVIFDKGMFKLLDIRTEKEVWNNLFDCIENCNVYLQGNIYENRDLLEDKE
nr:MAG TPA: YopX protein [Caudoviricetes sp.]